MVSANVFVTGLAVVIAHQYLVRVGVWVIVASTLLNDVGAAAVIIFVVVVVANATLATVSVPVVVVDSMVLYTVGVVIEEKQDGVSVPASRLNRSFAASYTPFSYRFSRRSLFLDGRQLSVVVVVAMEIILAVRGGTVMVVVLVEKTGLARTVDIPVATVDVTVTGVVVVSVATVSVLVDAAQSCKHRFIPRSYHSLEVG